MTTSRYFVARFAQAFGMFRRNQRMSDAASEMHLLREAETILGAAIWEKVEHVEELSVEYWNLRKLIKERDEVRTRLTNCQEMLEKAHDERAQLLNNIPEENQDLLDERNALLQRLEQLAQKRDAIVAEARDVRRTYVGLKMKLEVLTNENKNPDAKPSETKATDTKSSKIGAPNTTPQEQIDKVKSRLLELKTRFAELKAERIKIGEEIEIGDSDVDRVDEKLKTRRQEFRVKASDAFQNIGEGNKEISALRAESGVLDTRMRQLYAEIGRFVSRNTGQSQVCAQAASAHHNLVDVMRALRRSIALNHRLAGMA